MPYCQFRDAVEQKRLVINDGIVKRLIENTFLDKLKCVIWSGYPLKVDFMHVAASNRVDSVEAIGCLYEHGCPWDEDTFEIAIKNKNYNIVQYLINMECPMPADIMNKIVATGDTRMIKLAVDTIQKKSWLVDTYMPDVKTNIVAAKNGHLPIIEYLVEQKIPINEDVLNAAVIYGHLKIVKYIQENYKLADHQTLIYAAAWGHVEIVKYLHEIGIELTAEAINQAELNDKFDVVEYLDKNKCPRYKHCIIL